MSLPKPHFELARVLEDGTRETEIVPVTALPWNIKTDRRGFVAGGLTAAAALGALACLPESRQRKPSSDSATLTSTPARPCEGAAHTDEVNAIAIGRKGKILVSASFGAIKLWSLPEGGFIRTLSHLQGALALAAALDGETMASGYWAIDLWGLPEGGVIRNLTSNELVAALAFTPDGRTVISGEWSGNIRLRGLPHGPTKMLAGHEGPVFALAITPDGSTLVSAGNEKTIKLWSLPEGRLITTLTGYEAQISALAVIADGKVLASSSAQEIRLWGLPEGRVIKTFAALETVQALAATPDGSLLASGGSEVRLWRLPEGSLVKRLIGPPGLVKTMTVTPDGRLLASGRSDGTIQLWSLPDGEFRTCLIDLDASPPEAKGQTYEVKDEFGRVITYTLPCGSPIPAGAVCTCNCVPGGYVVAPPQPQPEEPTPGAGGGICTCNQVCVCIPICQAHRLLDDDPVIRTMAEELLLLMGRRELGYMAWAASHAEPSLRSRISEMMEMVSAGRGPDPSRWPGVEECLIRLASGDEVVAVMAAQMLREKGRREGLRPGANVRQRVNHLLEEARRRPWYRRPGGEDLAGTVGAGRGAEAPAG